MGVWPEKNVKFPAAEEAVMSDFYLKAVLTVIAASLIAIVYEQSFPRAVAALGECGGDWEHPCYMKIIY